MNIQQILGAHVRRFRETKGWSQDKLSEVSGLHRTYISGIERGVRNPTIEIVYKIAVALNVTAGRLFDGNDAR
ncbi:MAG: helix-turn-helix transcriptional regulator [Thiobacillus sp.]